MLFHISARVMEAIDRAPRAMFLPAALRTQADVDAPLPIGEGQTNSQPTTVAIMLDLLDVQRGDKVLDVGAGSGWTTAILSDLVGPTGRVFGVERHASLARTAQSALETYTTSRQGDEGFYTQNASDSQLGQATIQLTTAGVLGIPTEAPFQRILVSAMADSLPQELVDQLDEGGVMVIPVASTMLRVIKRSGGVEITQHGLFSFVPLVED